MPEENNTVQTQQQQAQDGTENQVYYSTGRGGAGNVHPGKPPPPVESEMGRTTPRLTTEYYSTGRGGAGNMKLNDDEQQARMAQDVEAPAEALSPSISNRAGRGGYGNLQRETSREDSHHNNEPGLLKRVFNFFKSS